MPQKTYRSAQHYPVGIIEVVISDQSLLKLHFLNKKVDHDGDHPLLEKVHAQLREYFSHKRTAFNLPLATEGTPFQKAVWNACGKIPYGKTATYGDIAKMIGKPLASRAVGNALNKNPHCIVTPCHRVVSSSGGAGGYAFGSDCKKTLISIERSA